MTHTSTLLATLALGALVAGCGNDDRLDASLFGDSGTGASAGSGGVSGSGGSGGASGAGGSGGAGASGTGGGSMVNCELQVAPLDPTALVDDLEDGDGTVAAVADRTGSWYFATDKTPGASATPTPDLDAGIVPERIPGGRCGSQYAVRVTGQGYSDWGTVVGMGLRWDRAVDVSTFTGIRFWARRGEQHAVTVRLQFQDKNSAPQGGVCMVTDAGSGNCYDNFGTDLVPLTTEWQLYQIDFRRLAQRDFGLQADALDTQNLFTIEWGIGPGTVFDFWVDDVWLY